MKVIASPHNEASELALAIYSDVLDAVRADRLVHAAMQRVGDNLFIQGIHIDLSHFNSVWIAGAGKASVQMAVAASEILGDRLAGGLIVTKYAELVPGLQVLQGAHPVPDETSLLAGESMLEFAHSKHEKDLVLFMLSGGASALMESLNDGLSLKDLQDTNRLLLASGADIVEMNRVRSQLSKIKAGGLADAFEPATVIGLVLSDVIGNDLRAIGSGPLIRSSAVPVQHFVIGSISLALHAAVDAARRVRPSSTSLRRPLYGEMRVRWHASSAVMPTKPGLDESCMIFGGETTVKIRGSGLGGRCQEMALAAAVPISRMRNVSFLAAGTDGADGPTDAAGAMVDPGILCRGPKRSVIPSERT